MGHGRLHWTSGAARCCQRPAKGFLLLVVLIPIVLWRLNWTLLHLSQGYRTRERLRSRGGTQNSTGTFYRLVRASSVS